MKKLIALLMALCMLLALAACGNQADAPAADAPAADAPAADAPAADAPAAEQVTISWAVRETDNYPLSLYDEMAANFMRDNPDIKIEIVSQGGTNASNEWLKTQLAAGTLPDVIIDANVFTDSPGALMEMPDHIKDLFLEGSLAQVEGSYCLVPCSTQYRMQCYYNKEYFEAAGVEIPTTWEEVIAACEKLEAAGYIPLIAPGAADGWACSYLFWSSNCNSDLMAEYPNFNTDLLAGNVKWNNPTHVESLTRWKEDLIDAGYYFDGSSSLSYAQACEEFDTGRAAMMIDGSWRAAGYDGAGVTDFGCFQFPNISGANTFCTLSHYWGVNAATEHPEEAWRFIEYVLGGDEETYKIYLEADGVFPVTKKTINVAAGPVLSEFMANLEGLTMIPEIPYVYGDGELPGNTFDVISAEIYGFFAGTQTAEQALDNLDAELAF